MLNVDLKTISKALSEKFLTDLTSSQTTAHGKNKHIGESGRIISDITEIAKIKKTGRLFNYNGHRKSIWFIKS